MIIKNKNLHLYESIENLRNFLETENKVLNFKRYLFKS